MKTLSKPNKTAKLAETEAIGALAALAQPQRLRTFRALVVAGIFQSTVMKSESYRTHSKRCVFFTDKTIFCIRLRSHSH